MEAIIKVISDYGFSLAIILIVFGLFGLIVYHKWKDPLLSRLKGEHDAEHIVALDTHELFSKIHKMLSVEIPNLELMPNKPVKQEMFRDILSYFVHVINDECVDITKLDQSTWTPEKWVLEMSTHTNHIIDKFKTMALNNGVPEIVMHKFFRWNQSTMELLYDHISTVGKSDVYRSNNERTNTLFLVIGLLIVITIGDAEKTIKELNGEISGKLYKGNVIED